MSYFLTSDNVKLYYEEHGEGKPLILIHGWSCSHRFFKFQIAELAKYYRVIAYDLRGHGISEVPEFGINIPRYAEDLKDLITHLSLKDVSLVGWSMGTTIIFEYIKQFGCDNLSKLCFIDMTPKLITDESWTYGLYGDFSQGLNHETLDIMNKSWSEFCKGFIPAIFATSGCKDKELLDWAFKEALKNSENIMVRMWISMSYENYLDLLPKISVPVLITYGAESALYSPENSEYMGKKIPNSKVLPFPVCGHCLHLEKPEMFNEELLKFLK
ncbi:alpha/beta fold hydrolase [Maledivibacter halophilus]|uniref:Pimeloyl-ACP methyl ester carboxylesterase n=1 Tax=Maledivibacter halophilus TaxID=36842 RepID=A0A1T5M444_9FIRM|nr:alpha/beta hydrolase [Maledivibacter halophilus]SKC82990.1 Pimeloyl-ACP methyl ester carboxylesterase [Maledivibacter halophilus]